MHLLALDQAGSRVVIRGPSFVSDGAEHRRLHRFTHCCPLDGWASVQDQMCGYVKCFTCGTAIGEDRCANGQARQGFGIGPLDRLAALVEARHQRGQVHIAMRGRPPIDVYNWYAESSQVQRKPFKADVYHPCARWQETMNGLGHSICSLAAAPTARVLLLSERRDDVTSVYLKRMLFFAAHQVDIELGDACFLKLLQPLQVRRHRPHQAVTVDDFI